jgi:hypothetical protein
MIVIFSPNIATLAINCLLPMWYTVVFYLLLETKGKGYRQDSAMPFLAAEKISMGTTDENTKRRVSLVLADASDPLLFWWCWPGIKATLRTAAPQRRC